MAETPLEAISGAGRIFRREADVIPASLTSSTEKRSVAPASRRRSWEPALSLSKGRLAPGVADEILFRGVEAGSHTSGSSSKTKGRPKAAEVETTAEDIDSSENFRERRGQETPEAVSLFIRL